MQIKMEYIFTQEMMELLDHFTSLTEVRIAFFSTEGEELCIGGNRSICGYCKAGRRSSEFAQACDADDQRARDAAKACDGIHFYRCHAGLYEAVVPVYDREDLIGYAMIGQFRVEGVDPEFCSERDRKEFVQQPLFTRDKVDDLLSMFQVLIKHIVAQSLVGRREFDLLGPLVERIRTQPEEGMTFTDAAQFVGLSPSRLSHLFRSRMGVSFKQFQLAQRLALADRLMQTQPDWRIARVASACGFEDPFYFSRVYKSARGVSPSKSNGGIE